MKSIRILILLAAGLNACRSDVDINPIQEQRNETKEIKEAGISHLEEKMTGAGLVNVQSLCPEIIVDLKYSTTDNFLKADVYGDLTTAYLQPDVAEKLFKAYGFLQEQDSSLTFLIYDAARPVTVQKKMWEIVSGSDKSKYVSNPAYGSVHNYGAAIDITLCTKEGTELDMGTPFDYFGELAQPVMEYHFLIKGELTQQQLSNRKLLRSSMQKAGFRQLPTEWWHYNACSREVAKMRYDMIE